MSWVGAVSSKRVERWVVAFQLKTLPASPKITLPPLTAYRLTLASWDYSYLKINLFNEGAQLVAAAGVLELTQGLGLNLADALARHVKLLAHFFQGVVGGYFNAKAHA
jgi:hypothetical protein